MIGGLSFAISKNPEVYDVIPGKEHLRLAVSRRVTGPGGRMLPIVRIVLETLDEDRVLLWAIRADEEDPYEEI